MLEYKTISDFFAEHFTTRVWKIPVNSGLGCPNRDGTLGTEGCAYCNNSSFSPGYSFSSGLSITAQLDAGVRFLGKKAEGSALLAYFQSFSNTYGPVPHLIDLYEEALSHPLVGGIVIATRPDCLPSELLDYFERRFGRLAPEGHPFLLVEIGIESTLDRTLELIGRGHDYECAAAAVRRLDERGIAVGAHIIVGLPGESEDDFITHARALSSLPLSTLKLHQLQIIRGTRFERQYASDPSTFDLLTPERYARIVASFVRELRPDIALDRFTSESPLEMVIAPKWGIKPSEFQIMLNNQ